jgi:hypothetical protein
MKQYAAIMPRRGAPVNLRPGGTHKQKRRLSRRAVREALRRGLEV